MRSRFPASAASRPGVRADQGAPVEARPFDGPSVSGGIPEIVRKPGRVDEQLLRHAAPDDAGSADPVLLREYHFCAVGGRDARSPEAARAPADNEKGHLLHAPPQILRIA